jgi:hypothetical protein
LGAVIGVTGAWGVGKRATDERYVEAKERGKSSTPGVNVEGNATVEMPARPPGVARATDQHPVPVVVTVPPKGPAFGGKSR